MVVQVARYVQSLRVTKAATKPAGSGRADHKLAEANAEVKELTIEVAKAKEQAKAGRKSEQEIRSQMQDMQQQLEDVKQKPKRDALPAPKREASPTRARSPEPKTESAGVKAAEQDMSKVCACVAMMTVVEMAWC